MSLAYNILAHRNAAQVRLLFDALYHPEDVFVFHIDRRSPADLHQLASELVLRHPNVHLLKARRIAWGGFALVNSQVEAARLAASLDPSWTHFVNLTGQEFPLVSRSRIVSFLAANQGRSFLTHFDPELTGLWGRPCQRHARYYLDWDWLRSLLSLPGLGRRLRALLGWANSMEFVPGYRRKPPFFHYWGGSNHAVLSRQAVAHITDNPEALRIQRWLAHSAISDESVFQSVLLNSHLAPSVVNDNLREIDFLPHHPHPVTWTRADLPRLLGSGKFWARKFDVNLDAQVLTTLRGLVRS